MDAGSTRGRRRRAAAAALAILLSAAAACTATQATPSPSVAVSTSSPGAPTPAATKPICNDNPGSPKLVPPNCVIPTFDDDWLASLGLQTPTPRPTPPPTPTYPTDLATLPPVVPWHGKTFYGVAGASARLIGVAPDDAVYVLVERAAPQPKPSPSPSAAAFLTDVKASLLALRPDGTTKPGWPAAGVSIPGFPMSYTVDEEGTVFIAAVAGIAAISAPEESPLTVMAVGADGLVLPGWPYRTAPSRQFLDSSVLTPAHAGTVCFFVRPDAASPSSRVELYCLGRDGKALPGFPFVADRLYGPTIGPDGTVYVTRTTSTKTTKGSYYYPFEILALGRDGRPKPGWTPPLRQGDTGLSAIVPGRDGRVWLLLGGDSGRSSLVQVDAAGRIVQERAELGSMLAEPNYKGAALAADGTLFVSVTDQVTGGVDVLNAYGPDGAQLPGWPQPIGGWGDVGVGADGSVWVAWTVYPTGGGGEHSEVALFDRSGRLQPGFPMAADHLLSLRFRYGIEVASDGTAYAEASTGSGVRILAMTR